MSVSKELKSHATDFFYYLAEKFNHQTKGKIAIWIDPVAYIHLFHAIHEELLFDGMMKEYKDQNSTSGATFMEIDFGRVQLVVYQKEEYDVVFKDVPERPDSIKELLNFVLQENIGFEFKPDRSRDVVVVTATEYPKAEKDKYQERRHSYMISREYLKHPSPMLKNTINNLIRIMTEKGIWSIGLPNKKGGM